MTGVDAENNQTRIEDEKKQAQESPEGVKEPDNLLASENKKPNESANILASENQKAPENQKPKEDSRETSAEEKKPSEADLMLAERVRKIEEREALARLNVRISNLPKDEQEFAKDLLQGLNIDQSNAVLANFEKKITERANTPTPPENDLFCGKSKEEALEECFLLMKRDRSVDACKRFEKICATMN